MYSWRTIARQRTVPPNDQVHHVELAIHSTTPSTDANSKNFCYSQAVKVGQTVKTSGQGGWDATGSLVPDVEKQVIIAFENVEKALKCVDSQLS